MTEARSSYHIRARAVVALETVAMTAAIALGVAGAVTIAGLDLFAIVLGVGQ